MFERIELQQLTKVIQEPRKFIQVVVGPRQVGKTTLVTQLIQMTHWSYNEMHKAFGWKLQEIQPH